jgi:hypothetical protein
MAVNASAGNQEPYHRQRIYNLETKWRPEAPFEKRPKRSIPISSEPSDNIGVTGRSMDVDVPPEIQLGRLRLAAPIQALCG